METAIPGAGWLGRGCLLRGRAADLSEARPCRGRGDHAHGHSWGDAPWGGGRPRRPVPLPNKRKGSTAPRLAGASRLAWPLASAHPPMAVPASPPTPNQLAWERSQHHGQFRGPGGDPSRPPRPLLPLQGRAGGRGGAESVSGRNNPRASTSASPTGGVSWRKPPSCPTRPCRSHRASSLGPLSVGTLEILFPAGAGLSCCPGKTQKPEGGSGWRRSARPG